MNKPLLKNQIEKLLKEKMEIFIDGLNSNNETYKSAAGRALKNNRNGEIMSIYRNNSRVIKELKQKYSEDSEG